MVNPAIADVAAHHDEETWQQKGKNRTIVSGRKNPGGDSGLSDFVRDGGFVDDIVRLAGSGSERNVAAWRSWWPIWLSGRGGLCAKGALLRGVSVPHLGLPGRYHGDVPTDRPAPVMSAFFAGNRERT
jgi:hypothetical protein